MSQSDSQQELDGMKSFQQAMELMEHGSYLEASVELTKTSGLLPDHPDLPFYQGVIATLLGNYEKALLNYSRAIELDPTDVAPYMNRGNTYDRLGRYPEALADFNHAIALGRSDATIYFNRANTKGRLGNGEDALLDYLHALSLEPTDAEMNFQTAAVLERLGRLTDALTYCTTAIELGHPQGEELRVDISQKLQESLKEPQFP